MRKPYSYSIYHDFINSYLPSGFLGIKQEDPIMQKLEEVTERNDQFFTISDLRTSKFLFASNNLREALNIEPSELSPGSFAELAHPEDLHRFGHLKAFTFVVEREVLESKKGSAFVSFTLRMRNTKGNYANFLCQAYFFYTPTPRACVYLMMVITDVSWHKMKKEQYHYFKGDDLSRFKFPDEELLSIVPPFTPRELEILSLIESGLVSKEIADKLSLSVYTVDTHRSHILKKSGKAQIPELIYELKEQGLL